MSELRLREHVAEGMVGQIHAEIKPPNCTLCWPDGPPPDMTMSVPPPAAPEPATSRHHDYGPPPMKSLGDSIESIRVKMADVLRNAPPAGPDDLPSDPMHPLVQAMDGVNESTIMPDGEPWCSACKGSRRVRLELDRLDPAFGSSIDCPKCSVGMTVKRRMAKLLKSLPEKYRDWRLESYPQETPEQRAVLRMVCEWLDSDAIGLYLHGPVGVGKSGLGTSLIVEAVRRGMTADLKKVDYLLDDVRQSFRTREAYDESESSLIEQLGVVEMLCLDDLGSERHKRMFVDEIDWATERLHVIIGGRHDNNRRTIFTSNVDLDDLSKILGHERTASRIEEMTRGRRWILDLKRLPNLRRETTTAF